VDQKFMWELILLCLVFETKHLIADFVFQTKYMLGKFNATGWTGPLAAHCGVHAVATLVIMLWFSPALWWLVLVDFAIHFALDWIKANPKLLGRYKMLGPRDHATATLEQKRGDKLFWLLLGIDQYAHRLTNFLLIVLLLTLR
jgi:hypothetical protein